MRHVGELLRPRSSGAGVLLQLSGGEKCMIGRVFIGGWVVLGNLWRSIDKGHGEYKDSLVAGNVIADICNHSSCHLEGDLGGASN